MRPDGTMSNLTRGRVRSSGPSRLALCWLDLMFGVALTVTLGAAAAPPLLAAVDDVRAAAAVRYVATQFQRTRMEAVARAADVGWQFRATPNGYSYAPYVDGNGNGLRTRDIDRGIDPAIGAVEHLADYFPGVEFGLLPNLPAIDAGGTPPGSDPIRLGTGNILTFGPLGTASPGSLYLLGRRNLQYAIRIQGETGRTHVVKFDLRTRRWKPV
jgi:hypothetical protein